MTDFLRPKYDIRPKRAYMMFGYNKAITDLPEWCAECGIELDFSKCGDFSLMLHQSTVVRLGIINTTAANSPSNMIESSIIKTVDKIILKTDGSQTFTTYTFRASTLANITFEGVIGNSIWFNVCKDLTTASLISILTALSKDSTLATGKTITFALVHQAKIEADADCTEQLNAAVAAGWTVAYV